MGAPMAGVNGRVQRSRMILLCTVMAALAVAAVLWFYWPRKPEPGRIVGIEFYYLAGQSPGDFLEWTLTMDRRGNGTLTSSRAHGRRIVVKMPDQVERIQRIIEECNVSKLPKDIGHLIYEEPVRRMTIRTTTFEKTIDVHNGDGDADPNGCGLVLWSIACSCYEQAKLANRTVR